MQESLKLHDIANSVNGELGKQKNTIHSVNDSMQASVEELKSMGLLTNVTLEKTKESSASSHVVN